MTQTPSIDTSPLPVSMHKFTPRDLSWLWAFLDCYRNNFLWNGTQPQPYFNFSLADRIGIMAAAINRHPDPVSFANEILKYHANSIIPDDKIAWIDKKNHRQLIWAMCHLGQPVRSSTPYVITNQPINPYNQLPLPFMPSISTVFPEYRYESIVTALDCWDFNLDAKIAFLLEKKNEWADITSQDTKTKWINKTDSDQLAWAWDYLQKHQAAILIPKPTNINEFIGAVFASLDHMNYYKHFAEKTLFIDKMRKTWSQKKFRDSGKAKKAYYLPLTIKSRQRLDWLAENYGCKPADVLERLITERHAELKKE